MTRIAFLGTPAAAVPALRALAALHPVEAVFCNIDKPQGRGRHLEPPPVKLAAQELGLSIHQPVSWKTPDTQALWVDLNIDLAIVVAYGHILPTSMLEACSLGVWNLHFSRLPRWRGAAPVNFAILEGDPETSVALMRITSGLDAGPVLTQSPSRPIGLEDTAESLLDVLARDAAQLLQTQLPLLLAGQGEPLPQDHAAATFASKLSREMSILDPAHTALQLHRQVRALQPWPRTECTLDGVPIKVCAVGRILPTEDAPGTLRWNKGGAWLSAGDKQALELLQLQRPGKPIQPALQALQPWGSCGAKQIQPIPS